MPNGAEFQSGDDPLHRLRNWLRSDMRILRWVFLLLYVGLIGGLAALSIWGEGLAFLIVIGVLLAAQAVFIFGAGTIELCRPIRKRRLWMPVTVAAGMGALLVGGFLIAMMELTEVHERADDWNLWVLLAIVLTSWLGWGVLLWRYARQRQRMAVLTRLPRMVVAGSLLELLAAVPSHVIVTRRPGCLVGLFTMMGIVAGLYVMLFAFGPMIFALFLRPRYRRDQMEQLCFNCGYDMRGSLQAGRNICPECGATYRAMEPVV